MTRRLIVVGLIGACQRRPSGRKRRAARMGVSIRGAILPPPARWQTFGEGMGPVQEIRQRRENIHPVPARMGCWTWPGMYGNGLRIYTDVLITGVRRSRTRPVRLRDTPPCFGVVRGTTM